MHWLIHACLRLRHVVVLAAALLIVLGIRLAETTPVDVFPEFAPPMVEIQTEAPGLSSTEVEQLVSVPLETALSGTPWLKTMRSKSVLGLSSVLLIFERDTDLMAARQLVQERLARAAPQLPVVARPPALMPPLSSTSRLLKIGVSSPTLSQMELTDIVRWTLRPRLMAVPGVANVAVWGQRDRQLQVQVDPERLRLHGVRLEEVLRAAADATQLGAGGFVDTPNQRLPVAHAAGAADAQELGEVVVAVRGGTSLRLADVTDVVEAHPPPIGDAIVDGGPGLLLIVEKQPWGNTLAVTRGVEAALAAIAPAMPDVVLDSTIFRPATFIELAIANLGRALALGCGLVVLILGCFLFDLRTAAISILAIPTSLLAAVAVLHAWGVMIDTMVLAGLVIALGEVVDDAIIDVENILRRLAENRRRPVPLSSFQVVLAASLEVRSAVVYATAIVILVFVPIVFLDGVAGAFFRPLALAYALAVFASMLVAITLTPALCLLLLPRSHGRESPLARGLRRAYQPLLAPLLGRPRLAVTIVAVLFAGTAASVPLLGEGFLPEFKEHDFLMHWVAKPGTSLEAVARTAVRASDELRAIPGVRNFGAHIGRAEAADEVVGPNFAELWISLDPAAEHGPALAQIKAVVDGYPGIYRDVQTYLREKMKEVLSGSGGAIVVRLFGREQGELRRQAGEVARALAGVEGVTNLKIEPQVEVPQIEVRFRPEAARPFGLNPGEVRRTATTLIRGTKVGEVYRGGQTIDVVVVGATHLRDDLAAVQSLRIAAPLGGEVALADVADVAIVPTPNVVLRESGARKLDITCDVAGRDLGQVAREIESRVLALSRPAGYHPEFIGEYAARQAARDRLLALSLLAVLGIGVVLFVDFRALRPTLLVFTTLPFALVGGVAGVWWTGGVLSLGSLVGLVTVLGIAARNGIMLVSHFRHLEREEGEPFGPALLLRGAAERVTPIVMTALATGLALVPLALGGERPGQEIEHPMAIVILGGLVTSTALNLFVVPVLYLRYGASGRSRTGTR
ncbi:efflux RND transporter permease subunit [Nannocystis radixulma]|uniref:Efflux RND transporter permease subunit n=1 Tax=Nannocystis radixulma TaxID=2995305 RepID=A0ABT5B7K5_9BACT|nr:efflux RND transporter permease subunit [Nannocystis radixulma]MDC0669443.1 efflux RND transporter permease subunit [Nannocystis radixulma]